MLPWETRFTAARWKITTTAFKAKHTIEIHCHLKRKRNSQL
jgi:hypothetical protein